MKRASIIFLQAVIVFIGLGAFVFMLWEPHLEGRNAHATLFQIYFKDPFLAYVYFASIFFFVAIFQAFKLIGYTGNNEVFSQRSVKSLQIIKYCSMTLGVLIAMPVAYLFIVRPGDDIAGGVAIGLFLMLVFVAITVTAATFERNLRNSSVVGNRSESEP